MTKEDIIAMATKAGFWQEYKNSFKCSSEAINDFAVLVAAATDEPWKWGVHSCGPTCNRYACIAVREAVLTERAAMMQLFTDPENQPTQHGTVTVEYLQREIDACAALYSARAIDLIKGEQNVL